MSTMEIYTPVIKAFRELLFKYEVDGLDSGFVDGLIKLGDCLVKAKEEFEALDLANAITEGAAREFYRDLCGTVYGNADKTAQGIMSAELIADHMKIPIWKAKAFLNACRNYGITERQGGGWVV